MITVRSIHLFLCSILMILGAMLVVYVTWTMATNSDLVETLKSGHRHFAYTMLAASAFMVASGMLGVTAGIYESTYMLKVFIALVIVEILLQVSGGFAAYVKRNDLEEFKIDGWNFINTDTKYFLQKKMSCCGFYSSEEYGSNATLAAYPTSCFTKGKRCRTRLHKESCWSKMKKWLEDNVVTWVVLLGVVTTIEMWSIFMAGSILKNLLHRNMVMPLNGPTINPALYPTNPALYPTTPWCTSYPVQRCPPTC